MKKILIGDDEPDALGILEKRFKQNGFDVRTAGMGAEVIRLVKSERPDVVLLDIVMPDMDGYAVAAALRDDRALKGVPVIFITGKDLMPEGIEKRVAELGAFDYITKPCAFEDILAKVKAVLG